MWCMWWGWGGREVKMNVSSDSVMSMSLCNWGFIYSLNIFLHYNCSRSHISISSCHVINDSKTKWFENWTFALYPEDWLDGQFCWCEPDSAKLAWELIHESAASCRSKMATNPRWPWLGKPSLCSVHWSNKNLEKLNHTLYVIAKCCYASFCQLL